MVLKLPFAILNPGALLASKGENCQRFDSASVEQRGLRHPRAESTRIIWLARKNEGSFYGQGKEQ